MTTETAVQKLNEIEPGDNESAHMEADKILIEWLQSNGGEKVAAAYQQVDDRVGFWYA